MPRRENSTSFDPEDPSRDSDEGGSRWANALASEKLVAAAAVLAFVNLIFIIYTMSSDNWWAVQIGSSAQITRGIFRVCMTAFGTEECHGNHRAVDFTDGDCTRSASELIARLYVSCAFHILGGLATLAVWMMFINSYRNSVSHGKRNEVGTLTFCLNAFASVSFMVSCGLMTWTFWGNWYFCGKPFCSRYGSSRPCTEQVGQGLTFGYVTLILAVGCSLCSFSKWRQEAAARKEAATEREARRAAAAAASSESREEPAAPETNNKKRSPVRRATLSHNNTLHLRAKRYFDVYDPDLRESEIAEMLPRNGSRVTEEEAMEPLVQQYGPELSEAEYHSFVDQRRLVATFFERHRVNKSTNEVREMLLDARVTPGGYDGMWDELHRRYDSESKEPVTPLVVTNPVRGAFGGSSSMSDMRTRGSAPPTAIQSPEVSRSAMPPTQPEPEVHPAAPRSPYIAEIEISPNTSSIGVEEIVINEPFGAPGKPSAGLVEPIGEEPELCFPVDHTTCAEDWNFDPETAYLWSDAAQVYYDMASGHYFEPYFRGQWFDPRSEVWYTA